MLETNNGVRKEKKIFNLMLIMMILLQLILPLGLHVSAMDDTGDVEEDQTVELQSIEDDEEVEKTEAEENAEAEEKAKAEAEAEAKEKAKAEEKSKAEAEEKAKAEEEKQAAADKKDAEQSKADKEIAEPEKEESSALKEDEPVDEEAEENVEEELEEINEEDIDEKAENYPDMLGEPKIIYTQPGMRLRANPRAGELTDTIEVSKTAERSPGCRTFEVTLGITGTPPERPVDVVLAIDRSGSMSEGENEYGYKAITTAPDTSKSYNVKINGNYQVVSYTQYGWRYRPSNTWLYVEWDSNGDDNTGGNSYYNPIVKKPFYNRFGKSRMYYAKQAAADFAGKVLGPGSIAGNRVSIVSYSGPSQTYYDGAQGQARTDIGLSDNLSAVNGAIDPLAALGGTNTEAGFLQSKSVIQGSTDRPNSNKVVIMFTDGVPTASNGNRYNEPSNINDIHIIKAIAAGEGIFQGDPNIADVFTVGLLQGMGSNDRYLAEHVLNSANNKGYYEAPTAEDLGDIFEEISKKLDYSAENAVVVDKVGDHFDLVESSLPTGATYNPATREITWTVGDVIEEAKLKYIVQAKPDFPGGFADTNEFAKLTYKDIFGTAGQTKDFPVPEVNVPTLIEIGLTDASITLGDSINLGIGTDAVGENYMSPVTGGDNDGINFTYEWRKVGDSTVLSTDKNPEVSPTEDTEYEVRVTDSNGCIAIATMTVTVNENIGQITIGKTIENIELVNNLEFFNPTDPVNFEGVEFEIKVTGPGGYNKIVKLKHGETEILDELVLGQYSVEEINIDERFLLENINPTSFELTMDNAFVAVDVVNKLNYANFEFTKVDEGNNPLGGIEFELKKGGASQTVITDENGKVSFNFLETGEYKLRETKTIAGFKLPTETWTIEVVRNEETGELEINIPNDSFLIADPVLGNTIKNQEQSEFPKTGGAGGLSYIASGLAILTTSLGLFIKKEEK